MEKEYVGIDYGMGTTNRDPETGIHYGVINQSEVLQAWADEAKPYYIYSCPYCGNELRKGCNAKRCGACYKTIDPDRDFDMLEPASWFFENDEYLAECSDDYGDIFITKSPYYTLCQYCSPCAPGAGYIMNTVKDGIKAYCFGHEFFEEKPTGKWVDCPYCNGIGFRKKSDIPNYDEKRFVENGGKVFDDKRVYCWTCYRNIQYGLQGQVKETIQQAPYPIFDVNTNERVW